MSAPRSEKLKRVDLFAPMTHQSNHRPLLIKFLLFDIISLSMNLLYAVRLTSSKVLNEWDRYLLPSDAQTSSPHVLLEDTDRRVIWLLLCEVDRMRDPADPAPSK